MLGTSNSLNKRCIARYPRSRGRARLPRRINKSTDTSGINRTSRMKTKVHLRWNTEDRICKWPLLTFKRGHLLRGRGLKEDKVRRPRLVFTVLAQGVSGCSPVGSPVVSQHVDPPQHHRSESRNALCQSHTTGPFSNGTSSSSRA